MSTHVLIVAFSAQHVENEVALCLETVRAQIQRSTIKKATSMCRALCRDILRVCVWGGGTSRSPVRRLHRLFPVLKRHLDLHFLYQGRHELRESHNSQIHQFQSSTEISSHFEEFRLPKYGVDFARAVLPARTPMGLGGGRESGFARTHRILRLSRKQTF